MSATSTATIMCTDVVGSTALRVREGDLGAQKLMNHHFELVRAQIESHGGLEVKTVGDGFLLAFRSAAEAVRCAIRLQRALKERNQSRPDDRVDVKVGINIGEVIEQEEDYFGAAVNAAFRIVGEARGGEILVSELLRGVVGATGDFEFVERGEFSLKGFPNPWRLYSVPWAREQADATPVPLAFLFTDSVGSSALALSDGDSALVRRIIAHNALVRSHAAAHSAEIMKFVGDGFLLTFREPENALKCAAAIQRAFAAFRRENPSESVRMRIGAHYGRAIVEAGEVFGRDVYVAASITAAAQPEQILVSAPLRRALQDSNFCFGEPKEAGLRTGSQLLYELVWQGGEPASTSPAGAATPPTS